MNALAFWTPFFARHAHQTLYHILSKPLTYDLVHAALDTLNRDSAPGFDGLGPKIYECFHQHFVPRMINITQDFESTATLPDSWSVALLNPISKSAGVATSGDLRPVVLQNSAIKWVTGTILLQLKDLMIYSTPPEQQGFFPGRNLHSHLFKVHASWRAIESGVFVAVHFAKALD